MRLFHGILLATLLFSGSSSLAETANEQLLSTFERSILGRSHFYQQAEKRERFSDIQEKGVWMGTSTKSSTLISPTLVFRDEQAGEEFTVAIEYSINDKGNLDWKVTSEGLTDEVKGVWVRPGGIGRPMTHRKVMGSRHTAGVGVIVLQPLVPEFDEGFGLKVCVAQGKKKDNTLTNFTPVKAQFTATARGEGGFTTSKKGAAQVEIRGNEALKIIPPTIDKVYDRDPSASLTQKKSEQGAPLPLKNGEVSVAEVQVEVDLKNAVGYRRREIRTERLLVSPHEASEVLRKELIRLNPIPRFEESSLSCASLINYRTTETIYSKEDPLDGEDQK